MATPSSGRRTPKEKTQADPGITNDPKSDHAGFDAHIWTSVNQIFERLGEVSQKIDQLSKEQGELKASVDKHDKIVMRVIYTFGGVALVFVALWFIYENLLKGNIAFTGNAL